MAAIFRRNSLITIEGIFLTMVATAFSAFVIQKTITVEKEAVSPQMQPLLLIYYHSRDDGRFELAVPESSGETVTVSGEEGSSLWFMCSPENEDDFKITADNVKGVPVVRNQPPDQEDWQLSYTKCKNRITASVQDTREACGDRPYSGTIYRVGFWVYIGTDDEATLTGPQSNRGSGKKFSLRITAGRGSKNKEVKREPTEFVSLYDSCFDGARKVVLYTRHTVIGSKFNAKVRLDSIPVLPDNEWLYDNGAMLSLYDKDKQFESFFNILNPHGDDVTDFNDRTMRYLVPLQLIPVDSMMFYPWRAAAFTQYNITGSWESIVGRGWRRVVETVDRHITQAKEDFVIATGTFQTLELGQKNRRVVLRQTFEEPSDTHAAVSRILWKLVHNVATHETVVVVSVNNALAKACEAQFCTNVCANDGDPLAAFKDPWTGCVYCCSYEQAKRTIEYIPTLPKVASRVLSFESQTPAAAGTSTSIST